MGKYLLLRRNPDELTRQLDWCDVGKYYGAINGGGITIRILRKLKLVWFIGPFLGEWKYEIKKYDTVVMFDNGYNNTVARYIKRRNPDCKIVLWFWNKIFSENERYLRDNELDEIWSYDMDDCKKYGLKYNTQFYNKNNMTKNVSVQRDLIFVGTDKGRETVIEKIAEEARFYGLKVDIIIPRAEDNYMPYKKYLKMVGKSKAILEVMSGDSSGLTLRPMEALYCNKKLVTNNIEIVNFDFYRPENIFVLGRDNMKVLKKFIDAPYKKVNQEIVEYYEFENWLKRFNKEKK